MRYDEGGEVAGKEAIEQSPQRPDDECRHDEHEIEGRDVDGSVEKGGDEEACVGSEAAREVALGEGAPKDFLGRSDDEEEQEGNEGGVVAVAHVVDEIDLRAREVKENLR